MSQKRVVTKEVPRGTIIDPPLFLVYKDDLPNGIASTARLFADYVFLINHEDDPLNCALKLHGDLVSRIQEWSEKWHIPLN
ncbi:unnamed protein product [Didymodactylos carnosus]|uniref:Uncharacterized protein n=1 Tax=Didymodactylos carnosus TaxID=1234261 RepID=A0A8S2YNH2_9BILA|nr:unnamed protein product [Didymodactylos carnosus]